jgi:hypothetical protein
LTLYDDYLVSPEDDYYNDAEVDAVNSTGAWVRTTISDYAGSTRVLTTDAEAFAQGVNYGIVPEFPEEAWEFWIMKALRLATLKPGSVLTRDFHFFIRDELKSAEQSFDDWISTRTKGSQRVRYTGAYHG